MNKRNKRKVSVDKSNWLGIWQQLRDPDSYIYGYMQEAFLR